MRRLGSLTALTALCTVSAGCTDGTAPEVDTDQCSEPLLQCPMPDPTGTWDLEFPALTAVGMTLEQGQCDFTPLRIQVYAGEEESDSYFRLRTHPASHEAVEGTCAQEVLEALGVTSGDPFRLLQAGDADLTLSLVTENADPSCTFLCSKRATGAVEARLRLGGNCSFPGCSTGGGIILYGEAPLSETAFGGGSVAALSLRLHAGSGGTWVATRAGG